MGWLLYFNCLLLVMRVAIVLCLFLTEQWVGLQYVLVVFVVVFCTQAKTQ